jgi:hypothetical protein
MTRQVKTYNPNHVFVDTNVLIGAYSGDVLGAQIIKPSKVRTIAR